MMLFKEPVEEELEPRPLLEFELLLEAKLSFGESIFSLINCFSYSSNWPKKLKFGDIEVRFDLTYLQKEERITLNE